jgi:hypothetical protein
LLRFFHRNSQQQSFYWPCLSTKFHCPVVRVRPKNHIWVLARSEGKLISIAVEGKVSEAFGPTVQEWQIESSPGKASRLAYLLGLLGLPSVPDTTRYQLLHRTASAIIEAQRFNVQRKGVRSCFMQPVLLRWSPTPSKLMETERTTA